MIDSIEKGDIYFFYRNKIDVEKAKSRDDIQRFYMITIPDKKTKGRLFLIGKKRLPEIIKNISKSTERQWLLNYNTDKPEKIGEDLYPVDYETKTRGKQVRSEAIPAGVGRYIIFSNHDSKTELAYKLELPEKIGKAQKELGILPEASYIISVKNPDVKVSGFPDESPKYPKYLKKKFADERWINISDQSLLDYENAQIVLIGAHKSLDEIGIKITGKSKMFSKLNLDKNKWPLDSLEKGNFAKVGFELETKKPKGDPTKGGRRGGAKAAKTTSAAGIAKALKGIEFPKKKSGLINYAKNKQAQDKIMDLLHEIPERNFKTMADVEKAFSEVR
jgi:hypothetical protein